tara:strand:+ start:578 stop:1675 length:1098 start_codon:yes stop_codon:yes gene_type:complete
MLYEILYPLKDLFSPLNIFQYITFRAAGAAISALLISFLIGPKIIRILLSLQIGETINIIGPKSHQTKKGTPTMGGVIIILSIILPTILWTKLDNIYIQIMLLSTIWMGIIGFIDDYLKIIKKMPKGLIARYKMAGLIMLGLTICLILKKSELVNVTVTSLPFIANGQIDLGSFYYILIILVVSGTSNAVNLTDGLDGLATGLVAVATLVFGMIAYISGRVDFSDYLNIIYIPGGGELFIYCMALVGSCIGFLWYNAYPASIFMGDTGSLSLGAALGTLAILLKKEILLIIIGGVFVIETISVIIQVLYFKYTKRKSGNGKKFFKMAPLHHHYELSGWPENLVVVRFWIIGVLLALMSVATFKVQ